MCICAIECHSARTLLRALKVFFFFWTDSSPVPKLCDTCYNEYDRSVSGPAMPPACCWCTDDALLRTYNITLHVASPGNKWAISLPVVKLITLNCQSWFNNTYLLSVRHLGQDSWFLHQTGLHARALALFMVESLWYSFIVVPYVVNIFPNTHASNLDFHTSIKIICLLYIKKILIR